MRLPIEGYRDRAEKSPATGVFGSGAWSFLPIQRSTALLAVADPFMTAGRRSFGRSMPWMKLSTGAVRRNQDLIIVSAVETERVSRRLRTWAYYASTNS
jgi:hypothetical protein